MTTSSTFTVYGTLSFIVSMRCKMWSLKNHAVQPTVVLLERHYDGVIMGAMASLITSLTIVYSTVYSNTEQRKHQSSAPLAFVWGIHRGPVNSPHKWPVTRKMFPFDGVIMTSFHVILWQVWPTLSIKLVWKNVTSDLRVCCVLICLWGFSLTLADERKNLCWMLSSYMTFPQIWKAIFLKLILNLIYIFHLIKFHLY